MGMTEIIGNSAIYSAIYIHAPGYFPVRQNQQTIAQPLNWNLGKFNYSQSPVARGK